MENIKKLKSKLKPKNKIELKYNTNGDGVVLTINKNIFTIDSTSLQILFALMFGARTSPNYFNPIDTGNDKMRIDYNVSPYINTPTWYCTTSGVINIKPKAKNKNS